MEGERGENKKILATMGSIMDRGDFLPDVSAGMFVSINHINSADVGGGGGGSGGGGGGGAIYSLSTAGLQRVGAGPGRAGSRSGLQFCCVTAARPR